MNRLLQVIGRFERKTTSCLDKRNELGVEMEPGIGVAGNVKPGAQVMPAQKFCTGVCHCRNERPGLPPPGFQCKMRFT